MSDFISSASGLMESFTSQFQLCSLAKSVIIFFNLPLLETGLSRNQSVFLIFCDFSVCPVNACQIPEAAVPAFE